MFSIELNQREKTRLLSFYNEVRNAGHWGSSDITIPEEKILLDLISNSGSNLNLTLHQLEMLSEWIYSSTGEGFILIQEDAVLINKIQNELNVYYSDIFKKYSSELDRLADVLIKFNKISHNKLFSAGEIKLSDKVDSIKKDSILNTEEISGKSSDDKKIQEIKNTVDNGKAAIYNNYYSSNKSIENHAASGKGIIDKITGFFKYTFSTDKDESLKQYEIKPDARERFEKAKFLAKKVKKI